MSKAMPSIQKYMTMQPHTIKASRTVAEAQKEMSALKVRHLPVVDDAGRLTGILSDRDIKLAVSLVGSNPGNMTVANICHAHPYEVSPTDALDEVAKEMAEKRYGIPVSRAHVENFYTDELFDIVVLRHILEHIADPVPLLSKINTLLKPSGLLLIVIPNINCIGRYVFKENWEWVLPWHLHFYAPKTLTRLLEKTGYKKLRIYQTPSPLWYPHTLN